MRIGAALTVTLNIPYRQVANASLDLRRGLDPAAGLAELLPRVVASMLDLTGAQRGFLLLAGPEGELEVAARSGPSWEDVGAEEFGGSHHPELLGPLVLGHDDAAPRSVAPQERAQQSGHESCEGENAE